MAVGKLLDNSRSLAYFPNGERQGIDGQMGVPLGAAAVFVPQHLAYGVEVNTLIDEFAGCAMAKLVEVDVIQPYFGAGTVEIVLNGNFGPVTKVRAQTATRE